MFFSSYLDSNLSDVNTSFIEVGSSAHREIWTLRLREVNYLYHNIWQQFAKYYRLLYLLDRIQFCLGMKYAKLVC